MVCAAVLLWLTVVAVVVRRNESDFLDVFIDCLLEQLIKTTAFRLDLAQIGELSADGDGVLMRGVAREAELLRVIDFERDSHGGVVVAVNGHEKTDPWEVGLCVPLLGFAGAYAACAGTGRGSSASFRFAAWVHPGEP